jgi:hypothetical protein
MTEAQIQKAVIDHWKAFGLPNTLVAAVPNAGAFGQAGLTKGLFDLIVIGGPHLRDRTGWLELKRDGGKLRPEQQTFKDLCIVTGTPYAVAFGRDEPITVLEDWRVVKPRARLIATVEAA